MKENISDLPMMKYTDVEKLLYKQVELLIEQSKNENEPAEIRKNIELLLRVMNYCSE